MPRSLRKRILFALNSDLIVQHLLRFVREQNLEHIEPVSTRSGPSAQYAANVLESSALVVAYARRLISPMGDV